MKKYLLFIYGIIFSCIGCIQINSHVSYDEKKSVQLYIKKFSSNIQNVTADLVSDDIKIKGDTKGETYVIVRAYGSGVQELSVNELQARVDKYYDIQIIQRGADELYIAIKQKINNISNTNGLAFYFEVHTAGSSSIKIKNISGNVDAEKIQNADASSVSGDIDLKNISGSANASSTSGDIDGDDIGSINKVSSVSGNIKMKVNAVINDISMETTSGNIHLQIPTETKANIDLNSMSGDVKLNDFPSANYSSKEDNKKIGTINGGGKSISINSTSGDIIIN